MTDQRKPQINELTDKSFILLVAGMLAFFIISGVIIFPSVSTLKETCMTVALFLLPYSLALLLRLLFMRLRIDESGVEMDNLLSRSTCLRWEEIRTAAVVHLNIAGEKSRPLIILSPLAPQEVLTRKAQLGPGSLKAAECLRIPHTGAREAAVQHYLGMYLAEYHL